MPPSLTDTLNAAAKNPPPAVPRDGEVRLVDLDLLDDNPYQPRLQMAEDALQELMGSIRVSGLLQPILVKPRSDGRFTIVAGHRRTAAYRKLRDTAGEGERAKFSRISAVYRMALEDGELAVMAYNENVTRAGLTPVEEGRALERLAEATGLTTADEIAAAVSQPVMKIKRLRRIAKAPKFIQGAVENGLMVVVGQDAAGSEQKERRMVDLMAALQFFTLFDHLREKQKVKPEKAEERTLAAMRRAAAGNWPFRRVEELVKGVIDGKRKLEAATDASEAAATSTELPPVFDVTAKRFVIDLARLASATNEQKAALEIALRDLLAAGRPTTPNP